jgi:signal-transduction protein with cAMP-binding, CBS, and nucleotidyltransferase domain
VIYETLSSATVKALNYGLLGLMSKDKSDEMFSRFPAYEDCMRRAILQNYNDDLRCFLIQTMRRFDYLHTEEQASEEMLHELAFCFQQVTFEKGSHLFNVDDLCNYMLIISEGTVEITTMMDNGTEMVIERLMQGSSINGQAFLVQDNLDVVARCLTKTTLYMLETAKFFEVLSNYPEYSEKI